MQNLLMLIGFSYNSSITSVFSYSLLHSLVLQLQFIKVGTELSFKPIIIVVTILAVGNKISILIITTSNETILYNHIYKEKFIFNRYNHIQKVIQINVGSNNVYFIEEIVQV